MRDKEREKVHGTVRLTQTHTYTHAQDAQRERGELTVECWMVLWVARRLIRLSGILQGGEEHCMAELMVEKAGLWGGSGGGARTEVGMAGWKGGGCCVGVCSKKNRKRKCVFCKSVF